MADAATEGDQPAADEGRAGRVLERLVTAWDACDRLVMRPVAFASTSRYKFTARVPPANGAPPSALDPLLSSLPPPAGLVVFHSAPVDMQQTVLHWLRCRGRARHAPETQRRPRLLLRPMRAAMGAPRGWCLTTRTTTSLSLA